MQVKLFYKLFGAFFLTSLMIVGSMILILQFNVSGSFSDYVNQVELQLHQNMIEKLKGRYEKNHNWGELTRNDEVWRRIIRDSKVDRQRGIFPASPPPQPEAAVPLERFGAKRKRFRMMHGGRGPGMGFGRRLSLFDENKRPLAGTAQNTKNFLLKPISLDGKVIGWLGMRKAERLSNPLDISFLKQQTRMIYLVGGGILLLAIVVAFLLSRHLLFPVKLLTQGTRAIANRRFDTRINIKVRDELGRLAADFNSMAETLEKFEEHRKQWITDISHELGTPLSILRGEIEAMQDGIRQMSQENLTSLHGEVIHLGKIVNDLRELSRAETIGLSLKMEPVELLLIIRETLNVFQTRLNERGIKIEDLLDKQKAVIIAGDLHRLQQVFTNLLNNSLRYTDSPGSLRVGYQISEKWVVIFFEDSGPGVPDESLPHLFKRLYRVDKSRSRALGGSGLGLAICKHIVQAHGGEITAANAARGGLRIEISLPLVQP